MATAKVIDLTNVKEGGNFNKKRQPEGDYPARITKVEDAPAKGDGTFQWCFTIQVKTGTYPYYCKMQENQLWKIRNLCIAAGLNVPKKRIKLDPEKLVGKQIAVTLEDDEYEGKKQSNIAATFPLSELDDYSAEDDDAIGDDADDEEEEVAPPPAKKAAKRKPAPAPEPEEDEDEEEEDEDEEEAEEGDELDSFDRDKLKRLLRKEIPGYKIKRNQSDDDLRTALREARAGDEEEEDEEEEDDEEQAPPPKKRAAKKRSTAVADVTDDELDELDIDEI